jgi:hypothetical protein
MAAQSETEFAPLVFDVQRSLLSELLFAGDKSDVAVSEAAGAQLTGYSTRHP